MSFTTWIRAGSSAVWVTVTGASAVHGTVDEPTPNPKRRRRHLEAVEDNDERRS